MNRKYLIAFSIIAVLVIASLSVVTGFAISKSAKIETFPSKSIESKQSRSKSMDIKPFTSAGQPIPKPKTDSVISNKITDQNIIFISNRDGNNNLWVVKDDGSHLVKITSGTEKKISPTWSKDETKIAYIYDVQSDDNFLATLRIIDLNGNLLKEIPIESKPDAGTQLTKLSWSKNDTDRLLYAADNIIFSVNINTNEITKLTNNPDCQDNSPDWSPDNSKIIFTRSCNGEQYADSDPHVWIMNADGSEQKQLTTLYSLEADWNCDGKTILFAARGLQTWEAWTMKYDGSEQKKITKDTDHVSFPSWTQYTDFVYGGYTETYNSKSGWTIEWPLYISDIQGKNKKITSPGHYGEDKFPDYKKNC